MVLVGNCKLYLKLASAESLKYLLVWKLNHISLRKKTDHMLSFHYTKAFSRHIRLLFYANAQIHYYSFNSSEEEDMNLFFLFNLSESDSIPINNVSEVTIRGLGDGKPMKALSSKRNIWRNDAILCCIQD